MNGNYTQPPPRPPFTGASLLYPHPTPPTRRPPNGPSAARTAAAAITPSTPHYSPVDSENCPMECFLHIWRNLRTGPSVWEAAWDKVNLTAKAISAGGFEPLYKQTFATQPNEKLKKTFASYLSTTTGPVAGTIYLSNVHVAFCSDRPLSFTSPSGQHTRSYYKDMVPLGQIEAINPVAMGDNPSEKYLQIVTFDGHDFWFMGFVNYDKATRHLEEAIRSSEIDLR